MVKKKVVLGTFSLILESDGKKVGRSQLYLSVNEMFQKMTCQVQPRYGTEIYTIFGIFCTSGKEVGTDGILYRIQNSVKPDYLLIYLSIQFFSIISCILYI